MEEEMLVFYGFVLLGTAPPTPTEVLGLLVSIKHAS